MAPNRISLAVEAARARGPVLDLTESNPTVVGLPYPEAEILAALADPRALVYEPSPNGLFAARAAVAAYYARFGHTVDPSLVTLTASTSEAYGWLFKLLCDPGDDILVPTPSYPLFDHLAALECVRPVSYPLRYHGGWFVDVEEVRRALTPRTRAILLVHPNNPTGSFFTQQEACGLAALAHEHDLALIADEVFADYGFAADPARLLSWAGESTALTFCLSGLSKLVGLPQLKLGWIVTGGPSERRAAAALRLELIADTYLSVASPVQHAAPRLLALLEPLGGAILDRVRANRRQILTALRGTAAQLLDAEGGWSAIVRLPATSSEEEWVLQLLEQGVLVHPGFFFDLPPTCIVISLLVSTDALSRGLEILGCRL